MQQTCHSSAGAAIIISEQAIHESNFKKPLAHIHVVSKPPFPLNKASLMDWIELNEAFWHHKPWHHPRDLQYGINKLYIY